MPMGILFVEGDSDDDDVTMHWVAGTSGKEEEAVEVEDSTLVAFMSKLVDGNGWQFVNANVTSYQTTWGIWKTKAEYIFFKPR